MLLRWCEVAIEDEVAVVRGRKDVAVGEKVGVVGERVGVAVAKNEVVGDGFVVDSIDVVVKSWLVGMV